MELILKSVNVDIPQEIENIEALKQELIPKLEHYKSLVVTEDSIKEAKSDRAKLNKLKKAIDEQRITIKKQCMEVYEPLEAQCKELISLIDAPVKVIDEQVKAFEKGDLDRKREELRKAFETLDAPDYVVIEDVISPKWANKSMSVESLTSEMLERINKIKSDEATVELTYKDEPSILYPARAKFRETKSLSSVLVVASEIKYQIEKAKRENAQNTPEQPQTESNEVIPPEQQKLNSVESEQCQSNQTEENTVEGNFHVKCTKSKLKALVEFMKSNSIQYNIIK